MKDIKKIIKDFIPPVVARLVKKITGAEFGFFGDYKTWEDAGKCSPGYDSDVIFERVRDSLVKVRDGKAVYERDSVLFDQIEYSWPLLSGLMLAAAENGGSLSVLDFGGSLGSTFFQNQKFLKCIPKLKWNIVEHKKIVEYGRRFFENDILRFYFEPEECFAVNPDINVIILSSVIHYMEKPYDIIKRLLSKNADYIIVDRTPLLRGSAEKIVIQKISPEIAAISCPAWLLSRERFLASFSGAYDLFEEFEGFEKINIECDFKGFIFKKKTHR